MTASQRDGGHELSGVTPHDSMNHGVLQVPVFSVACKEVQPIGLDAVVNEELHWVLL